MVKDSLINETLGIPDSLRPKHALVEPYWGGTSNIDGGRRKKEKSPLRTNFVVFGAKAYAMVVLRVQSGVRAK
jgi:hypothetical protein